MRLFQWMSLLIAMILCSLSVLAQDTPERGDGVAETTALSAPAVPGNDGAATVQSDDTEVLRLKAEIAKAEAEKAKAEAEIAKANAQTAKANADAEQARADEQKMQTAQSVAPQAQAEEPQEDEETEEQPNHRGFYLRFTPGLGFGTVWGKGTLDPLPGVVRIDDPRHRSLTGAMGLDLGAGIVKNLALHVGLFFEKMIFRDHEPAPMAFSLFGVDAGLTWYFTDLELYLTGQFRWAGMLVKYPTVACSEYFEDTFDWYRGPGLSVTFGREWYESAKDQRGAGIGLQANYYRLHGGIEDAFAFNHFSLLLVLTFTRF